MIITKAKKEFTPIIITLESQDEVDALLSMAVDRLKQPAFEDVAYGSHHPIIQSLRSLLRMII